MGYLDYNFVYPNLVEGLYEYCKKSNVKSMVLGISGGIDSTLTAAIAHSVSCKLNIPLIGVSLPSGSNENEENNAAVMVGNSFCNKFETKNIDKLFGETLMFLGSLGDYDLTRIACGNVKARLRMITLYHIASLTGGIVLDTDNMTEHFTGFFTIHGDVGDIGVLRDMNKSEIFEFADWIIENKELFTPAQREAVKMSRALNPTDGNGVGCDLEQFGLPTYADVDKVVRGEETENVGNVLKLHDKTWYKRVPSPLYIDTRSHLRDNTEKYLNETYLN